MKWTDINDIAIELSTTRGALPALNASTQRAAQRHQR